MISSSINSNGKKRKAPVPPRQVTTSGPLPNVCAIPEETPVLLTHESSSSALQKAIPKPAPAPRTSLETGIRPASDNVTGNNQTYVDYFLTSYFYCRKAGYIFLRINQ